MKPASREWNALAGAMLLDLVSVALAHGHDENARMEMSNCMNISEVACPHSSIFNSTETGSPSYFRHPEYSGLMLLHIVLMSIAWIFVLPLGMQSHCFCNLTLY